MGNVDLTPFFNAGVLGVILFWFMFRLEKALKGLQRSNELMARTMLRFLEHLAPDKATELSKELNRVNGND